MAFNKALGVPPPSPPEAHTLRSIVAELEDVGLVIDQAQEDYPVTRYLDVGAVVFQLRSVPWQVPGFEAGTSEEALRRIDAQIRRTGSFEVRNHRFLIRAHRPASVRRHQGSSPLPSRWPGCLPTNPG
jgi:hypothetical protein